MDFIVNTTLTKPADATTTPVANLVLPAEAPLAAATNTRQVSLNEMESEQVCVETDLITGAIIGTLFSTFAGDPNFLANCAAAVPTIPGNLPFPMAPREALLGVLSTNGLGQLTAVPKMWGDPITETPSLNTIETWEIFNTTIDAHPVHLHLVAFQVINREGLDPNAPLGTLVPTGVTTPPNPNEMGYKDTVVALPGQITRIKAKFDIAGLYVWHCHIVEHEDNEMMRPFVVQPTSSIGVYDNGIWYLDLNGNRAWDGTPTDGFYYFGGGLTGAVPVTGDWTGTGATKIGVYWNGIWYVDLNGNGAWDGTPTDGFYYFGGGLTGAVPVTGDWTGTGTTKIGVYDNGIWYVDLNGNGAWDGTPTDGFYYFGGGLTGAVPVTGDWTGTGTTKIGVYVDGVWYLDLNGNGVWDGTPTDGLYYFGGGLTGAVPVTGDWTGTGTTKIGVYVDGFWYVDLNGNGAWDGVPTDVLYPKFGGIFTTVVPVTGNW